MSKLESLVSERTDLDTRLHRLYAYLETVEFDRLPRIEKYYLRQQSEYMEQYSEVLLSRIELIDGQA